MAVTEMLASGTTALASSDFTVSAGTQVLVYLKDAAGPDISFGSKVYLRLKDGSDYYTVDVLDLNRVSRIIQGVNVDMTYQLYRPACTDPVGASRT